MTLVIGWIPIDAVDADENGDFEFTVPAGRIRVTAMTGVVDTDQDRDLIVAARGNQNSWAQWDANLYTPQAEESSFNQSCNWNSWECLWPDLAR